MKLKNFCFRYLKAAPASFTYKMLRKKNIVLNGKKADGNEVLQEGDLIRFFLSDETIRKFSGGEIREDSSPVRYDWEKVKHRIIFENNDYLIYNKPVGQLSQKAKGREISANEILKEYVKQKEHLSEQDLQMFHPSVCNRLDRNTSGILLFGKTEAGSQYLSEEIRENRVKKTYLGICYGNFQDEGEYHHWLKKDREHNQSEILSGAEWHRLPKDEKAQYSPIWTGYRRLKSGQVKGMDISLLEIHLHTGKSHQIRSDLNYLGYPLVGDPKYGDPGKDREILPAVFGGKRGNQISQMLHCWKCKFGGREYTADPPETFTCLFP